ncbi:MAG: TPM domain-containing protein [Bacteroidia bacterium]
MKRRLSQEEEKQIVDAIRDAELLTSGEIRVHIEARCKLNPLDRAAEVFVKLGMEKTRDRNGVLIYIALDDRKLAIAGDSGINQAVPDNFWNDTKSLMVAHFQEDRIAEGVKKAVLLAGEQLGKYFPLKSDDSNELSNEISRGDDIE